MAALTPYCPNCQSTLYVRPSDIPSGGLLINWCCTRCNVLFVSKLGSKQMYMILRNPETYNNSAPKKFFETLEQATEVAKKMAREHRDTFYVIKLVKKVTIHEIPVTVEDL